MIFLAALHGISFIKYNGCRLVSNHASLLTKFHLRIAEACVDLGRKDEAGRQVAFCSLSPVGGAMEEDMQVSLLSDYHKIQGKISFLEEKC